MKILPQSRVSGQKPVDDFLNEEGQIRLGKRQAWRQAKIVAGASFKIARTPALAPLGYARREQNVYRKSPSKKFKLRRLRPQGAACENNNEI